jgi:SAM-dependent methyltransferase
MAGIINSPVGVSQSRRVDRSPEALLVCPYSHAALVRHGDSWDCADSGRTYPDRGDFIDFLGPAGDEGSLKGGFAPALMRNPALVRIYERFWRPAFMLAATRTRHAFDEELAFVRGAFAEIHGTALCDLSCGPGIVGRRLAQSDFAFVWGLDASEPMLRTCAEASRRERVELPLVRADVGRLPFCDASFMGMHAGAALHVWPDPARAMMEVGRCLAPGGVFVASTFLVRPSIRSQVVAGLVERVSEARAFREHELFDLCRIAGLHEFTARSKGDIVIVRARRPP